MRWWCVGLVIGCNSNAPPPPPQQPPMTTLVSYGSAASLDYDIVSFPGDGLTLYGYLFSPPGPGPFPAIVFNHGSEEYPGVGKYIAQFYVENGFVFFLPHRRGHGRSHDAAPYIGDAADDPLSPALADGLVQQSDDVIAAAAYVGSLPYVDKTRIATIGCSFGGIEALFAAEQGTGLVSAVDFAGASYMWDRSPPLRERMKTAARNARIPVFFIQAENDANTAPTLVLSQEMRDAGKPTRAHVFPPHGETTRDGHGFCVDGEFPAWGPEVLDFLMQTMRIGR
jgi:dienelactone hydrolase